MGKNCLLRLPNVRSGVYPGKLEGGCETLSVSTAFLEGVHGTTIHQLIKHKQQSQGWLGPAHAPTSSQAVVDSFIP